MQVKIISITKSLVRHTCGQPMELSAEELIVYTARVSNPSNQANIETSEKLLNYLIKNKHWSPLDMVDMTVEIKTSRAIAQQILRHWSFDFQEFSQRYAEAVDIEPVQIREAGSSTRQGSIVGEFNPTIQVELLGKKTESQSAKDAVIFHLHESQQLYKALLEAGVAKECARMVLPLTTQTTMYMKGSARSWFHYLEQRLDKHAQLEHRQVAQEVFKIYEQNFPCLSQLLTYNV